MLSLPQVLPSTMTWPLNAQHELLVHALPSPLQNFCLEMSELTRLQPKEIFCSATCPLPHPHTSGTFFRIPLVSMRKLCKVTLGRAAPNHTQTPAASCLGGNDSSARYWEANKPELLLSSISSSADLCLHPPHLFSFCFISLIWPLLYALSH